MVKYQKASRRNEDMQSYLLIHRYGQDTRGRRGAEPMAESGEVGGSPWLWNEFEDLPRILIENGNKSPMPTTVVALLAAAAEVRARAAQERDQALWCEPVDVDGYVAHREQWL